ncbi:MAG: ornithine cyclodeaminase family protein [Akkermansiaceae bacterium]|nr:ornithine cyclodeaminase family protein [Armatimonadota bacterium]
MALLLNEENVSELLTMPEAISAVENAFTALADGSGMNHPRERFFLPQGVLHHMAAALPAEGVMGTKTYTSFRLGTRFFVQLFSSETGELLAYIEGNKLGQVRTGAATGVAAKYMSRGDAESATIYGAGWQAEAQAEALVCVRPGLRHLRVFSRDGLRAETFCQEMTRRLNIHCAPYTSAEAAGRETEIIICATSATQPFFHGEWLSPGDFVAAVGANRLSAQEADVETIARADIVAVDDLVQAKTEAAELIFAHEQRRLAWEQVVPLSAIASGRVSGRETPEQITVFKSLGVALEDIAVAALIYEKAKAQGVGQEIPFR